MSDLEIVIRRASVDDAEVMSRYMNVLADEELEQLSGLRPSTEEERDFLRKASENECTLVLLALDGGTVVGILDLWPGVKAFDRHTGRLGMSVLAPYRRKGIGKRLLESAVEEAKKWPGFYRIELDVVPWNEPAIRLYEAVGFVREGTKSKAGQFRGKFTDLVLMALTW